MDSLIAKERILYHKLLMDNKILTVDESGTPSNADKSSTDSCKFAKGIAEQIVSEDRDFEEKALGQTSGAKFEEVNRIFLERTFLNLQNIRPGDWRVLKLGNRSQTKTSSFLQYEHLAYDVKTLAKENLKLASSLANGYLVAPDIVICRDALPDEIINKDQLLVDETISTMADLRLLNSAQKAPILHASISSKWTIRSDRAQNSRTEALNLIRNRKGHLPHIVVVTGEPLPSRLSSIALGTGDIDCVYHFALYELIDIVKNEGSDDSKEMLRILIDGKRLKDISDLPLDLAV